MRVGVVGVGVAGSSHLFDLVSDDRFEVAAVCAKRPDRATRAADLFGVPAAYSDPHVMLEQEGLEGLVVAVPPAVTAELVDLALSAGLIVLVDKPAAVHPDQLRRLLGDGPTAAMRKAVVAYNRRYQRHVHAARALVAPALSSSVATIDCSWSGPFVHRYVEEPTYRRQVGLGDGVLLDTASHIIDTLACLGFVVPTVEHARLTAGPSGADVAADLRLRWEEAKTPTTITVSEGEDETWSISIQGPGGHLVLTRSDLRGTWHRQDVQIPGEDLRRPADDLIEMANDRPVCGASLSEAAAVLETIQKVRVAAGAVRRAWKRPRAKALGRLNGAC